MKKIEIEERIKEIEASRTNRYKKAYWLNDTLKNDFIRYVSLREDNLGEKARLILAQNKRFKNDGWVEKEGW